ncbi:S8 family peptidase [Pararhodonellum marinum]|uniref:S8 family peptidase n=1 Tax=Pararhodonellum marinum TaxID=2755358 RepID=UPI001890585E|nr:S8 family peptidase [Pararhodonellum marinum]
MKKSSNQRYLITFADDHVDTNEVSKVIGVPKSKCKEGVEMMASDHEPKADEVMVFENLGISSAELTAEEAEKLSEKPEITAVEEDYEMYALAEVDDLKQFDELFGQENGEKKENFINEYMEGYNRALADVFAFQNAGLAAHPSAAHIPHNSFQPGFPPIVPIPQPIPQFPPFFRQFPHFPHFPLPKLTQPVPWNIEMVKAPQAWARGLRGQGVRLAILDSGISTHPDLVISGGVSFIPGETDFADQNSHGTHCAGIAAAKNNMIGVVGVAPECNLFAVKVLQHNASTGRASGMSSWIIAGMDWCISNGIKVANMSLGGGNPPSTAYANAVKRCQDNGVTVVIASGNSYGTSFPWVCAPANSVLTTSLNSRPIAVGSINQNQNIAGTSSRGGQTSPWNQVTVVAPGVSINSTIPNNAYGLKSGTSMACPHVAGLAALIIQRYPGITPYNVNRRIATTSSDLGHPGLDTTFGYGLINCDLATR